MSTTPVVNEDKLDFEMMKQMYDQMQKIKADRLELVTKAQRVGEMKFGACMKNWEKTN